MRKILIGSLLMVVLTSCNYGSNSATSTSLNHEQLSAANIVAAKIYTVNKDSAFIEQDSFFAAKSSAVGKVDIKIDDKTRYQSIEGFGAALTDSSAYLIYQLPEQQRKELLTELFASNKTNFSLIRVPLGASDFARNNYSYDEVANDTKLEHFSIAHDEDYIIPVLQEIKSINPNIQIIATPWSAPWWMKTNNSYFGIANDQTGELRHDMMQVYADYVTKAILAYRDNGIDINYLTLQNEPLHAPDNYGGMYMTAQQQHELIGNIAQSFDAVKANHQKPIITKVLAYDHNWDHPEYPEAVLKNLSAHANNIIAGTAYHCYGGDVSAQSETHKLFPHQKIFMTECSGGDWANDFNDNLTWDMSNLFIGVLNNWGNGSTKWNLALDQNHGPYVGGCTNCRGLLTINTDTKQIQFNEDYYSTASMSKFIKKGAVRIDVQVSNKDLEVTGVTNPDASVSLIIVNNSDGIIKYNAKWHGKVLTNSITGKTVNIISWNS